MLLILSLLVYTAFCYWVIVMDGAEVLEGWGAFALLGWFAASLTPSELKFYVGISWLASLVTTLFLYFSATPGTS
jgi:hypothetical protein